MRYLAGLMVLLMSWVPIAARRGGRIRWMMRLREICGCKSDGGVCPGQWGIYRDDQVWCGFSRDGTTDGGGD